MGPPCTPWRIIPIHLLMYVAGPYPVFIHARQRYLCATQAVSVITHPSAHIRAHLRDTSMIKTPAASHTAAIVACARRAVVAYARSVLASASPRPMVRLSRRSRSSADTSLKGGRGEEEYRERVCVRGGKGQGKEGSGGHRHGAATAVHA